MPRIPGLHQQILSILPRTKGIDVYNSVEDGIVLQERRHNLAGSPLSEIPPVFTSKRLKHIDLELFKPAFGLVPPLRRRNQLIDFFFWDRYQLVHKAVEQIRTGMF